MPRIHHKYLQQNGIDDFIRSVTRIVRENQELKSHLLSGQENESRRRSVAFLQHLTKNFYKDEGDQFKGRDLLKMIETPSEDLLAAIKNEGLSEVDAPWVDQFRQQTEDYDMNKSET